jgi:hypothetical protein
MVKAKSKANVMVTDGDGGMVPVQDRRFDKMADWLIHFEVPKAQADTWLQYFDAECAKRGWSRGSMRQIDARENSGSITVTTGDAGTPQLAVVWERKRAGALNVRARSAGTSEFSLVDARALFELVNERCQSGATDRFYRRGQLHYEGLAWRGELWLDDTLRLGPPSQQDETCLINPRVILVDAVVDCIGQNHCPFAFDQKLRELSAFLSVIMGTAVRLPQSGRVWTYTQGVADCATRWLGYFEPEIPHQMPSRGESRSIPLQTVNRPDFSLRGIGGSTSELFVPADITDLWARYRTLTPDRRRDFLQAAAKWQESLSLGGERGTLSCALMVVACEALKPLDAQYKEHNIYQVVGALLGQASADRLRLQEKTFRPQNVRNAHLHRGEFLGAEFVHDLIMSSYQDPTFDQMRRELARITQAAIIEWLRRGGVFTMPPLRRSKN